MIMEFDSHKMQKMTPAQRFCKYFEAAKLAYCQMNECDSVTHKAMVMWYNEKYKANITEASLSKYLKGVNDVPIEVYINVKDLAGIEEIWIGPGASKNDYDISLDLKESLEFIQDEVECMCMNQQLKNCYGSSMQMIIRMFMEYCEHACNNDYVRGLGKLKELQKEIYNIEKQIMENKSNLEGGRSIKKSYRMEVTSLGCSNANQTNSYDLSMNVYFEKIRLIRMKLDECISLQKKIELESYVDIPMFEERKMLRKLGKYTNLLQ